MREARRAAKFALSDAADGGGGGGGGYEGGLGGGGDALTHGGVSLEELEDLSARPDALADLDDGALEDLERRLHFGGGGGEDDDEEGGGGEDGGGGGEGRRKTRKEVRDGSSGGHASSCCACVLFGWPVMRKRRLNTSSNRC